MPPGCASMPVSGMRPRTPTRPRRRGAPGGDAAAGRGLCLRGRFEAGARIFKKRAGPSSSSASSAPRQRVVDPFEMPPAEAVRVALAAARASEVARAAAALRHEFRADRVAAVDLTFDASPGGGSGSGGGGVAASPLYAPAFVFVWDHYGTRVPTVVSGSASGQVAGDRALDAARVAAAAAVASVAAMAVAGGPPAWLAGGTAAGGGGVLFGGMALARPRLGPGPRGAGRGGGARGALRAAPPLEALRRGRRPRGRPQRRGGAGEGVGR